MTQDRMLLAILGVLLFVNALLVASILLRTLGRRRSWRRNDVRWSWSRGQDIAVAPRTASERSGLPMGGSVRGDGRDGEDGRAAAAIEAFVAEATADAGGRARLTAPRDGISRTRAAVTGAPPRTTAIAFRATPADRPGSDRPEPPTIPLVVRSSYPPSWTPTGLADHATWDRTVREESARVARFGRPVTVVLAELPGLDGVAHRLGRDVADRVVSETARLLVTKGRAADRIAWLGDARFGVLLMETEEIAACDYVNRVRTATDGWLESAGLSMRLSLGWASAAAGDDVMAAVATAEQRMHEAHRRSTPGATLTLQA